MRMLDLFIMGAIVASFATNALYYNYHKWTHAAWTSAWFERQSERSLHPETRDACTQVARSARQKLPSGLVYVLMRRARAEVDAYHAAQAARP